MHISRFDFHLPPALIAQHPPKRRTDSRLLVVDRASGRMIDRTFSDLSEYLSAGDALVLNNSKVFNARVIGKRASGGELEIFFVRPLDSAARRGPQKWHALVSPSRRVKPGFRADFGEDWVELTEYHGAGVWTVSVPSRAAFGRIIKSFGHLPLPPYIKRTPDEIDMRRYQTVFARSSERGAVAAPTAGLHFTKPYLRSLARQGVTVVELSLHVGPGTFKPISADHIEEHQVDAEYGEILPVTATKLNAARDAGGRIVAVGTTVTRTLESSVSGDNRISPCSRMISLYIRPGFAFRAVDRLVTNFHLPKSSLLVLVAAFAGYELTMHAYDHAVRERYRFYSYGDAMLII